MQSFEVAHAAPSLLWHLKGPCLLELGLGTSGDFPFSDAVLTELHPKQLLESVS